MNQVFAALDGAWKVLAAGLILGAGLPALFSVGIRQLALSQVPQSAGVHVHSAVHKTLAWLLFLVVILGVLLGLAYIVAHGFGYAITFDGILPIVKKK